MGSANRYVYARLICEYLTRKKITQARVTAREIARFHNLDAGSSRSISALLNFLSSNGIRKSCFGFYMMSGIPIGNPERGMAGNLPVQLTNCMPLNGVPCFLL
jgi:hypothetical protein